MENLHNDILENIFSRLPIEAALHAKCVCTTWRAILHKPGFLFAFSRDYACGCEQLFYEDEYDHYDHAKMNYYHSNDTLREMEYGRFIIESFPGIILVASCNGLVCFGKYINRAQGIDPFLICNPVTRESIFVPEYNYFELPLDKSTKRLRFGSLNSGFGYCSSTNVYKVVTIYRHQRELKLHVQVYTVGGKWRYIGLVDCHNGYIIGPAPGIYANGVLYWLQYRDHKLKECEIMAFDLETEKFSYINLPCSNKEFELNLLGGNNCLYLVYTNNTSSRFDIWAYKKNNTSTETFFPFFGFLENLLYRSSSSWIKEFSIQLEICCCKPFAITRSNEVLLWSEHERWKECGCRPKTTTSSKRLYCYDPKTSTLNQLWDDTAKGMQGRLAIEVISHTQSIVSLEQLGAGKAKSGFAKFLEKFNRSRGVKRKRNC